MASGRFADAAENFSRAIELQHDLAEAHHGLGNVRLAQGRAEEATDCLRLATHFAPASATAHLDLGIALQSMGDTVGARDALSRALSLEPRLAEAHRRLAELLAADDAAAVSHYRHAFELSSKDARAHCQHGHALFRLERYDEAEAHLRTALEDEPQLVEAHHNLGLLLLTRGNPQAALGHLEAAAALKPGLAETLSCIGHALRDLGRYQEALARYDEALAHKPDFGDAIINRAYLFLALGRFEEGWREHDRRFDTTGVQRREFPYPVWTGEDLGGKTILMWSEQGIGDQIRFASLLPDLAARARCCVLECAGKLVPLFARSFPGVTVVPRTTPPHPETRRGIDLQVASGSAARWLRRNPGEFPGRPAYLAADTSRVTHWRSRLDGLGQGLKIGFSWRSSLRKGILAQYSSQIEEWDELFGVAGVHWICLQYDDCAGELESACRSGVRLHRFPQVDYLDDLDEVAALISALDLVVSAPTSVSEQAAALGVEVWQLGYGPEWQLHGTGQNLWFPTMSRYERRWNQQWREVNSVLARKLRERVETVGSANGGRVAS